MRQVGDMSEVTINFGMEEPNDTDILTEVADTVMNIDIGVLSEDDGDNESNTSVVIEEKSVHALEGRMENERREISSPVGVSQLGEKSNIENNGAANVIETMTMSNPIEAEPIPDEETSHDTLEEPIDTNKSESTMKVHDGVPNVELEAQSSDLDGSEHRAVDLESETAVKREEISTAGYILSSGAYLLPHPSKASTGGDDAYFIVGQNWLGVADGVSAWSDKGIDPGIYSRELMENCRKIVSECNSIPLTNPEEVISESALEAKSPGSSTILVAYFDGQVLHVANIGDSGFIVIRNGVVYKKSTPRSFEFNCPFQIKSGDDPSELVEMYEIDLDEGDVIVTSTDGLFDNLYNPEIISIVSKSMQSDFKLEEIAEALARRAHEIGNSTTCMTPFVEAVAALRTKEGFTGGKLDDVVVIVSLVQKISSPHMEEEISTAGYILPSGAYLLPHPSKASTGGDDAYFIVGQNWLGVADGVSAWSDKGIDPGIYSRELMENCRKIVSECNSIPLTNPEEVISESALEAKSPGSSTILVAYFDGQVLHVANIGDSGFIVIRNGVVYKKSTPRSFEFNCPFQIKSGDDPSELVEMYEIDLDEGDVIVTSTDGLFDNLYNPEIISIVSKSMQSDFKLEEIAEALARRAHEIGNSTTCMTPFVEAVAALRTKEGFTGGKLDDVVVIVSLVQKISSPHME
ncbi:hypothetical protein ACSBR1_019255 [Camellia fascicularis]